MPRLSKRQWKAHEQAEQILKQDVLNDDDKEFVLNNWHEGAGRNNQEAGAFFTPLDLAYDFALSAVGYNDKDKKLRVLDLCAGIGVLGYAASQRHSNIDLVCVEISSQYIEVGKKILPNARWIQNDVMDLDCLIQLGVFDVVISNPPFGRVRTISDAPMYRGSKAEYKVIDISARLGTTGVFIIAQSSAPFNYSGVLNYEQTPTKEYTKFCDDTGITLDTGLAIDTTCYSLFKDTNIKVEFVEADFSEVIEFVKQEQFTLF